MDVPVSHLTESRRHFRLGRQMSGIFIEAPGLHQRPDRDIESALALAAVILAGGEQMNNSAETLTGRMAAVRLTTLHSLSGR